MISLSNRNRQTLSAMVLLAPSLLIFTVFSFGPMIYAFFLSFMKWDMMSPNKSFIGLANYQALVNSPEFWKNTFNTFYFAIGTVPGSILLGLVMALLVNNKLRGRVFFRGVFFTPVVTSTVAISIVWMWVYHPDFGVMNQLLQWVGLKPQRWLADPVLAMPALIIMNIWKHAGYNMILFLIGLQNISPTLYEAAKIDGANSWRSFKHITWPMLGPTTFFITVITFNNAMKVFTQIHTMTQGGPNNSTSVLMYLLYQEAFRNFRMGRAAAIAYFLFCFIFIITIVQKKFSDRKIYYEN